MDIFDKDTRSRCMSHIRSKDTKPEIIVRHYLFARGYRYRKNCRRLPGTPDIVMRKYGVVIFIHGCFWHGHEDSHLPQTNVEFWRAKIERNKARDAENREKLKAMGWNVMTVWECQLKPSVRQQTLKEIEYWINKCYLDRMQPLKRYRTVDEEDDEVQGAIAAEEIHKR
jgi:DNA mismatch endonuclease (patch repair protein)